MKQPRADQQNGDRHNIASHINAWATVFIAIFTAATIWVSVSQYIVSQAQYSVIRDQLTEMRTEQRAWVYATAEVGGQTIFPDAMGGMRTMIAFNLKNVGHLPAHSVTVLINMMAHPAPDGRDYIQHRRDTCREGLAEGIFTSLVLFPGQEFRREEPILLSRRDIEGAMKVGSKVEPVVSVFIVGCIDYRLVAGGKHYQTGFAYRIVQRERQSDPLIRSYELDLRPTPIAPEKLQLLPSLDPDVWVAE